jgi:hypothetical protein
LALIILPMNTPKFCLQAILKPAVFAMTMAGVVSLAHGQSKSERAPEAAVTHDEIVDQIGQSWTAFAPGLASLTPSARIQAVENWKASQAANFQKVAALEAQLIVRQPVAAGEAGTTARKLSSAAGQELAAAQSPLLSAQERILRIDAFREKNRAELAAAQAAINQEIATHKEVQVSPAPASPQMTAARAQLDTLLLRNVDLPAQERIALIDARRDQLKQAEAALASLQKSEIDQSTKTAR